MGSNFTCETARGGGRLRGRMKKCVHDYNSIISLENLLEAWQEFRKGKTKRVDVQEFGRYLMKNLFSLHEDLKSKSYEHGSYEHFVVNDPKRRDIHKASVRDRVLHHVLYRKLYPFFDTTFIADSYSCRKNKGTHRAMKRFEVFTRKVSNNYTKQCFVLKCDIRKFFASIDHIVLMEILQKRIKDKDILWLLERVVGSFDSRVILGRVCTHMRAGDPGTGSEPGSPAHFGYKMPEDDNTKSKGFPKKSLPLGNLTSQLFVNIYMNEFDQFVKHGLTVQYYIRYADDFVFVSRDNKYLEELRQKVEDFLTRHLTLSLHPDKVFIKTIYSGVNFLGWVHFPKHKVLRTVTKKRMFRKVNEKSLSSYLGLLSQGNAYKLSQKVEIILELQEQV